MGEADPLPDVSPGGYRGLMELLLSEAEVEGLPAALQGHYRTSGTLRSLDDLAWFPAAKREALERLIARGALRTVDRIRRDEGDDAADAAAREIEASRVERAHQVGSERRAS